jgi:hypothetical protein
LTPSIDLAHSRYGAVAPVVPLTFVANRASANAGTHDVDGINGELGEVIEPDWHEARDPAVWPGHFLPAARWHRRDEGTGVAPHMVG